MTNLTDKFKKLSDLQASMEEQVGEIRRALMTASPEELLSLVSNGKTGSLPVVAPKEPPKVPAWTPDEGRPPLRKAVALVMTKGKPMNARDVQAALEAKRWLPESNNIHSYISYTLYQERLAGVLVQSGRGFYELASHKTKESQVPLSTEEKSILALVKKGPSLSREISIKLDLSQHFVIQCLKRLKDLKLIRSEVSGNRQATVWSAR